MRLIRIGIANINATVGAVKRNTDRAIDLARSAEASDVTVLVMPEQVIGGYAAEDLVQWGGFVTSQWKEIERFAVATADTGTVYVVGVVAAVGGDLFNCASVIFGGNVLGLVPKEKLPTYNVFYEARTFSRGVEHLSLNHRALDYRAVPLGDQIFAFDFGTIAVEVCEDAWSPDGPMRRRCYSGAELVCNVSASPYRAGVAATRREMLSTRASDNQAIVAYANLVGANDGLIFDGGGFVNQNGRPVLEVERFREGVSSVVVDMDRTLRCRREASTWRSDLEAFRRANRSVPTITVEAQTRSRAALRYPAPPPHTTFFLPTPQSADVSPRDALLDELYEALSLGVADYYLKTGAFRSIAIALSGGRDSLLTTLVAYRALQRIHNVEHGATSRDVMQKNLHLFFMPSRYSSEGTTNAAQQIADDLGARYSVIPIEDAFVSELEATTQMLGTGTAPTDITKQNIQARIRGQRMWNFANSSGALFLQTGNMSEKSLGYTTVGGDLEGALSVIANLPKTVVIAMIERLSVRLGFPGIRATLNTVAGPELAEKQSGEAELMPFEVLDACLYLYGSEKLAADEVALALPSLFPSIPEEELAKCAEKFARLFHQSIFKWVQAPLALHVGSLDLDRERALQLPVVEKTEWVGGAKK
jgi:NAD+ synthase (glutamine-hydrolysing)